MHLSHSYISEDFAFLMQKELDLYDQFREYNLTRNRVLEVTYYVISRKHLIFKLDVEIKEKE